MRFHEPWILLALLIPILLFGIWKKRSRPPSMIYPITVPNEVRMKDPSLFLLVLKLISLSFVIVALSRPQDRYSEIERKVSGVEIYMVMDVSASMNIEDLAERSRLEVAKDTMRSFVERRVSDRIGFIVFSGEALTLAPPTLDYSMVVRALREVETGILKDGTAIGDGLSLAVSRLRDSKAKSRVVILLTDGDNNAGQVDPATAGDLAAGYGIRVYSIAIGKEGRVKLPIRQKGLFGRTVTTYQWFDNALNTEILEKISEMTHGKFYRVTDLRALSEVFAEIDRLEKSDIVVTEKTRYEEKFSLPLKLALAFLLLERTLSLFWWRILV